MEIWIFGGVFCNFGFGLRKKSWKFGFSRYLGGYSVTSDLDLGKKVGNLDFRMGGVFCNFGFGLRKKSWKFGFSGGGVFCNFGFGLRKKIWKIEFRGGGGYSVKVMEKEKNLLYRKIYLINLE